MQDVFTLSIYCSAHVHSRATAGTLPAPVSQANTCTEPSTCVIKHSSDRVGHLPTGMCYSAWKTTDNGQRVKLPEAFAAGGIRCLLENNEVITDSSH